MKTALVKLMIALIVGSLLLSGCAQTALKVKPLAKTAHPSALADKLKADLATAKAEHVDVLSPTWYARAQASHAKTKEGLKQGGNLSEILDNVALGNAQLMQAQKYAENSRQRLAGVIKSRDAAYKAGAEMFGKEFNKVESRFLDLTESIEDNELKSVASGKKSVDDQFRALELRAIKHNALSEVRQMLKQAKDEDVDDTAPKSYLMAKQK